MRRAFRRPAAEFVDSAGRSPSSPAPSWRRRGSLTLVAALRVSTINLGGPGKPLGSQQPMSFVLAAAALAFSADKSGMELIELKSGNVLKGEVLKERDGVLWV